MRKLQIGILVIVLAAMGVVVWQRQAVLDWIRLIGYTPPAAISTLASEDTMTPLARHLLYVNHPLIESGQSFLNNCPSGSEKTIVLGCYKGGDNGIFIYDVTDSRLQGVEQVTAAHEMLHAAYARLSGSERSKVDQMLLDYYNHDLHDQRIQDVIASYRQSEPNDVVNEMHSVFGSEIADLPSGLETYYRQYFTDRQKIAAYAASYQGEFTSRQQAVAAFDSQLTQLKSQIDTAEADLSGQQSQLKAQANQLDTYKSTGDTAAYNAGVPAYNAAVAAYNQLVQHTKQLIQQYNDLVDQRNALALEERQLTQAITASPQSIN